MPGIYKSRTGYGTAPVGHYYVTYEESAGSPTPYGIMTPQVIRLYKKTSGSREEYIASYCGSGMGTSEQKESDLKAFGRVVDDYARSHEVHFSDEAVDYLNLEASSFGLPTI